MKVARPKGRGRKLSSCWYGALLGCGLAAVGASQAPARSPLDEPLRLIAAARQSYQGIRDYTCLLVKREHLRGQLQPENLIVMKVRTQPFSVYLRWHQPKQFAGQEVCYVEGRNRGMMRVHSSGLLGAVGFISLDPNDPRVRENSRHTITEAGIGNLIERLAQRYEADRRYNNTQVRLGDYVYDQRRCRRVETIHANNAGGEILFYRNVVYFDQQTHLPIRVENYDWPRPGGNTGGDLLEVYAYANLRLNVGLGDEVFNH